MNGESFRLALIGVAIFFFLGATQALYGPLVPGLRAEFNLSSGAAGLLFTAHGIGEVLGVLAPTILRSTQWAQRHALSGATFLMALGAAGFALAPTWSTFIAAVFVLAFGFGVHVGLLNALFVTGFGRRSGTMSQIINAGFSIGAILGPIAIAYANRDSRSVFSAIALLSCALLPAAGMIDRQCARSLSNAVPVTASARAHTLVLGGFVLVMLLTVGVESCVGAWTTTLAKSRGADFATAANFTSLFFGSIFVGRVVVAFIGRSWKASATVLYASIAISVLLALALMERNTVLLFALTGLAIAPIFSATLVWLTQTAPNVHRVSGLVIAGAILGSAIFPPLVGMAIDRWGASATVPATLLVSIAAVLAVVMLQRARSVGAAVSAG